MANRRKLLREWAESGGRGIVAVGLPEAVLELLDELETVEKRHESDILAVQQKHFASEEQHVAYVKIEMDAWCNRAKALEARAVKYEEALRFYADSNFDDGGDIAREALAETVQPNNRK